ncbi:MAG: 50S ribosomal protein L15 [Patescibacteria group bacterium]
MQLHKLTSHHARKEKKTRVGRGGKRGTTSGKGTKGQKSRSGRRIRPAERDMIQRIPKLRGFKNRNLRTKIIALNVGIIGKKFSGGQVSISTLQEIGLITKRDQMVKILGDGEIKSAVTIHNIPVSAEARKKIEAAGGKIVSDIK